jgi:hypothetical protein
MKCMEHENRKPTSVETAIRKQATGESFDGILWKFHFILSDFRAENYIRQENAYLVFLHINHRFSYSKGQIAHS